MFDVYHQASVNMYSTEQINYEYVDFKNVDATEKIWKMFTVYHVQKDGSEFFDVTLASEDDNDNSDVIVICEEIFLLVTLW